MKQNLINLHNYKINSRNKRKNFPLGGQKVSGNKDFNFKGEVNNKLSFDEFEKLSGL